MKTNGSNGFGSCQSLAIKSSTNFFAFEAGSSCGVANLSSSDLSFYIQNPDIQCSMRCGDGDLVDGTLADKWTCGGIGKQKLYQLKV